MLRLACLVTVFSVLPLIGCPSAAGPDTAPATSDADDGSNADDEGPRPSAGGDDGGDDLTPGGGGTDDPGGDDDDGFGDEPDVGEDPDGDPDADGDPGIGDGEPGAGDPGAGLGGLPCGLFHDGWAYAVGTYYEPGEDPIVVSVSGTANFAADGTYEQNYRIGGISNIYSGTYTLEGDRLTTFDEEGAEVFDYRVTCSDELKELVLTLENEDGTPSIVFGLESLTL